MALKKTSLFTDALDSDPLQEMLFEAVAGGDRAQIASVLVARPDLLEARALEDGRDTPLTWAALHGRQDSAEELLKAGASLEARSGSGFYAPLHQAAVYAELGVAQWFVERGANPHAKAKGGIGLLLCAAVSKDPAMFDWALHLLGPAALEETLQDGHTPLLQALAWDQAETAIKLLDAGADAKAINWNGEGAVALASGCKSIALLDRLLAAGADPQLKTFEGHGALVKFCAVGDEVGAKRLLGLGCDPNAPGEGGFRAISQAIFNRREGLAEDLVRAGASLDFLDGEGRGLLQSLTSNGQSHRQTENEEMIQRLKRVEIDACSLPPQAQSQTPRL